MIGKEESINSKFYYGLQFYLTNI